MRARQSDPAPERYRLELPGEAFSELDLAAAWALIDAAHTRAAPGRAVRWRLRRAEPAVLLSHATDKSRWRAIAPLPRDLGLYLDAFGLHALRRALAAGAEG